MPVAKKLVTFYSKYSQISIMSYYNQLFVTLHVTFAYGSCFKQTIYCATNLVVLVKTFIVFKGFKTILIYIINRL